MHGYTGKHKLCCPWADVALGLRPRDNIKPLHNITCVHQLSMHQLLLVIQFPVLNDQHRCYNIIASYPGCEGGEKLGTRLRYYKTNVMWVVLCAGGMYFCINDDQGIDMERL